MVSANYNLSSASIIPYAKKITQEHFVQCAIKSKDTLLKMNTNAYSVILNML
jgi:hypothetical protein